MFQGGFGVDVPLFAVNDLGWKCILGDGAESELLMKWKAYEADKEMVL